MKSLIIDTSNDRIGTEVILLYEVEISQPESVGVGFIERGKNIVRTIIN